MAGRDREQLITVEQYYLMEQEGILKASERLELIAGEIIEMAPIHSRHAGAINRLNAWFQERLGGKVIVSVQNPVRLTEVSEPQPDLAVLKPRSDYYENGHPGPGDIQLLVEVSDSSLDFDTAIKAPIYAKAGIPEYWILDLQHQQLRAFSKPDPKQSRYMAYAVLKEAEAVCFEGMGVDAVVGAFF